MIEESDRASPSMASHVDGDYSKLDNITGYGCNRGFWHLKRPGDSLLRRMTCFYEDGKGYEYLSLGFKNSDSKVAISAPREYPEKQELQPEPDSKPQPDFWIFCENSSHMSRYTSRRVAEKLESHRKRYHCNCDFATMAKKDGREGVKMQVRDGVSAVGEIPRCQKPIYGAEVTLKNHDSVCNCACFGTKTKNVLYQGYKAGSQRDASDPNWWLD